MPFDPTTEPNRRPPAEIDRRSLLKLMGASLSLAGLVGCTGSHDENALPYVRQPEGVTPGIAKWYATAVTFCGLAQPVLGKTYTGRPVKLEGNPDHPAAQGKSDAFTQAALLGLYDPNRSRGPRRLGTPVGWASFRRWATENAAAMDRRRGEGFRLLTGPFSSPTLARQIRALLARWPLARWHILDDGLFTAERAATQSLFGQSLTLQPSFDQASTILAIEDDFLGPGPRQTLNAVQFGAARRKGDRRVQLLVAEAVPSATGAVADQRLALAPDETATLLRALAARLGLGVDDPAPGSQQEAWISKALAAATQGRTLLTVGTTQPAALVKLGLLINERLGALGRTLHFAPSPFESLEAESIADLVADMAAGKVETLLCLDTNPVYHALPDLDFTAALGKLPLLLHAGLHFDETAARAQWHLPLQHDLESWSDARAVDGTTGVLQPLVRPFFDVRSRHGLLDIIAGGEGNDDRALVSGTWRNAWGEAFEEKWRAALFKGFVEGSRPEPLSPAVRDRSLELETKSLPRQGLTALIRPDATVWDGVFSENAWLQETPKPLSKLVWENVVQIAPALAARHGLADGDMVEVSDGHIRLQGPVFIARGQADETLALTLGYGRAIAGGLSEGIGHDAGLLRRSSTPWRCDGLTLTPLGKTAALAFTQPHQQQEGRDFVRSFTAREKAVETDIAAADFYPPRPPQDPSWGMTIDLDLCIGCNACVTACQAENNIPVVGKAMVAQGRAMHWLRVDHYTDGPGDAFQPVPCMHCEQAPCEMGCPVNAAVHSIDGLNLQVYNRCIGTRTCSSYCPYKVRRFNWFDYTAGDADSVQAMRNPQVTVRSRGVMEKCTYCVQRIEEARIAADRENQPLGDVVTACQQACPTQAIVFGNIADPGSHVSRTKADPRNYTLLEEANTRPRTTYLARIRPEEGEG